jgi:hypothetical protein
MFKNLRFALIVAMTNLSWCGCWMQRDHPPLSRRG